MLGESPSTLNCIEKILKVEHVKAFFQLSSDAVGF